MHKIIRRGVMLSLLASSAYADTPPSAPVVIDVATVNGSGCPAGTAAVDVSPGNAAFTITYSDYLAQVGPDAAPTEFRKNCQVSVAVHAPQGFTYAIARAEYAGHAALAAGATGLQRARYYFQGQQPTAVFSHPFAGPVDDDWVTTDVVDLSQLAFAPCGAQRNLNINTELRVIAGTSDPAATSWLAMDSETIYHFVWQRCP